MNLLCRVKYTVVILIGALIFSLTISVFFERNSGLRGERKPPVSTVGITNPLV